MIADVPGNATPPSPLGVRAPAYACSSDGAGASRLGVLRVLAELLLGPALPQQIPAAIELDLHGAQPVPVRLQGLLVLAVLLLPAAQVLLLADQPVDLRRDALVAHGLDPTPRRSTVDLRLSSS
jgi:hypothetical protein